MMCQRSINLHLQLSLGPKTYLLGIYIVWRLFFKATAAVVFLSSLLTLFATNRYVLLLRIVGAGNKFPEGQHLSTVDLSPRQQKYFVDRPKFIGSHESKVKALVRTLSCQNGMYRQELLKLKTFFSLQTLSKLRFRVISYWAVLLSPNYWL